MAPRRHASQPQRHSHRHAISLILESTPDSTSVAAQRAIALAKSLSYNQEQRHDIELAVREVVANAILHGNHGDPSKRVFFTATGEPSGLVIRVRDEGQGFDPASVPDPRRDEALVQESGRGLFLMNASMDEVAWTRTPNGGMEVTLTKYPARRRAQSRNGKGRDPAST